MPEHTAESFLQELRARRIAAIRSVRFKDNRSTLVSVSRDGRTLHVHRCFRTAPADVVDAIATFLRARRTAPEYRQALRRIREWPARRTLPMDGRTIFARRPPPRRPEPRPGPCAGTPAQRLYLWRLYARLNQTRFGGRLPANLPIRLSGRMTRRWGQLAYFQHADGTRKVVEIALNLDLMLEGNDDELLDTMLHEMAHAEAWLVRGDGGHGPSWLGVAERVGCEPLACTNRRLRRRPRGARITRVPPLPRAA